MKFLLIFLLAIYSTDSLRILSVLPTVTKSHYAATKRIIKELINRGHEVVSISPFEEEFKENYTWVPVEVTSLFDAVPSLHKQMEHRLNFFDSQKRLWDIMALYTKYITQKPKLAEFIKNDHSKFDLVIAEEFFQQCFFTFAYKYKAPLILISTFGSAHYISEYMGNPLELSYVPHEFVDLFGNLGFLERAKNAIFSIYDIIGRRMFSLSLQDEIAKELFKDLGDIPSVHELERNASLLFLNSHYSLSVVRPFLPNVVEIGGIHIEDVKPLNKELQDILDGATDGAILFSFGSVMELAVQPDAFVIEVLNALGSLRQTVLVKWNSDKKLPVQFGNVYPFKWLPQNDVLAHPNIVLFVTHGGLLSSQETIYHGIPTICIPFYGDQPLNCERSVQMGYGVHLEKSDISTAILTRSINGVLSDSNYKNQAKELSRRFKDRLNNPINTAMYWIEYTARHKGNDFMKGPKRNLYWFQYYYVDLIVLLLVVLKLINFLIRLVVRKILSFIRPKSNKVKINNKKVKRN